MNAATVDIKDILINEGDLGLTFGTNLFISREPTQPDDCVTLYDTGGPEDDLTLDRLERYERPRIQVRSRANNYTDAYGMIQDIRSKLQGRAHEVWNGAMYTLIRVASGPEFIEYDGNNRAIVVLNLMIQRRPA